MLKRRFGILRRVVPNCMMTTQINVVIACCAVHKFIRDQRPNDMYFAHPEEGDPDVYGAIFSIQIYNWLHSLPEVIDQWIAMRDAMMEDMFTAYTNTRQHW